MLSSRPTVASLRCDIKKSEVQGAWPEDTDDWVHSIDACFCRLIYLYTPTQVPNRMHGAASSVIPDSGKAQNSRAP